MLELRLFNDLEHPLQFAAANVLAGSGGDAVHALEYLMHANKVPVTGVDSGKLVAVYGLPYFMREGNILTNSDFGLMATEPQGMGVGTSMLGLVKRVFEATANDAQAVLVHRAARDSSLLLRCGYKEDGTFHDNVKVCSLRYAPKQHSLTEYEKRIVAKLLHSVQVPAF